MHKLAELSVCPGGLELEDLLLAEDQLYISLECLSRFSGYSSSMLVPAVQSIARACVSYTEGRSQAFAVTIRQKRQGDAGFDAAGLRSKQASSSTGARE